MEIGSSSHSLSSAISNGSSNEQEASLFEVDLFQESLSRAEQGGAISDAAKTALQPLDHINNEASKIVDYAKDAVASGNDLTPSEIVMLTARSQEFMFHCQLTSNIANRTSDGLQQLFRQQG